MLSLNVDIKLEIASKGPEIWYVMYRCDPEFCIFARSIHGISKYAELFTEVESVPSLNVTIYRLFGNINRACGLPAVVYGGQREVSWYPTLLEGPYEVDPDLKGVSAWYHDGKLHRDNDLPAVVSTNGMKEWYQHGKVHRHRGPAVLFPDGSGQWLISDDLGTECMIYECSWSDTPVQSTTIGHFY